MIFSMRGSQPSIDFGFLGDDVDVDSGGLAQKAVDDAQVEKFLPIANQRAAEDDLSDVFGADEIGDGVGDTASFEADDDRSKIFREAQIGFQDFWIFLASSKLTHNMDDVEFGIQSPGHPPAPPDQALTARPPAN